MEVTEKMAPTEIEERLFLGGQADSLVAYDLVINCTTDIPFAFGLPTQSCLRVAIKDNGDLAQQHLLYDALINSDMLQQIKLHLGIGDSVLVHCRMGQQRSSAVIAAYLMYSRNIDVHTAVCIVRERRPESFFGGHINFIEALEKLQLHLSIHAHTQ